MPEEDLKLIWTTAYVSIIAVLCNMMENKVTALQAMIIALVCWFVIMTYCTDKMSIYIEEAEHDMEKNKTVEE